MGIETYLMIAACYGLGCVLCYRQGMTKGIKFAISETCDTLAEMTSKGITGEQVAKAILDYRQHKRKLLKAKGT